MSVQFVGYTGDVALKDPDATSVPYVISWVDYLSGLSASETIVSSSWSVTGPDSALTIMAASIVTGGQQTQVRISGGTAGALYWLTDRITTSSGVVDDGSIGIQVEPR